MMNLILVVVPGGERLLAVLLGDEGGAPWITAKPNQTQRGAFIVNIFADFQGQYFFSLI